MFSYMLHQDYGKSACTVSSLSEHGDLIDSPVIATVNGCLYKLDLSGCSDSEVS